MEKESAETEYWLEICEGAAIGNEEERHSLLQEARELLAIFISSGRTARSRRPSR